MMLILAGLLMPADTRAQNEFYRYRNSYYKYRFGKATKRYKRACTIIRRNQKSNDRFMARLFRRKSAGGDMQTE